ncbi:MAG: hypothetical protein ACP5Q1_09450 [Anaerolineae bacterium]
MPTRIAIPQRVVVDIRIAIPRLGALALLGDERVGLGVPCGDAARKRPRDGSYQRALSLTGCYAIKVQAEFGGVGVLPGVL